MEYAIRETRNDKKRERAIIEEWIKQKYGCDYESKPTPKQDGKLKYESSTDFIVCIKTMPRYIDFIVEVKTDYTGDPMQLVNESKIRTGIVQSIIGNMPFYLLSLSGNVIYEWLVCSREHRPITWKDNARLIWYVSKGRKKDGKIVKNYDDDEPGWIFPKCDAVSYPIKNIDDFRGGCGY